MKKLFALVGLLLGLGVPASAQYTSVSATVQDSAGTPYVSGSYTVSFVNTTGQQALFGGNANFQQNYTGSLDATGSFTISLPSNSTITPTGTQWKFGICASDGQSCFNSSITITGTSQSISSTLNAASPRITFTTFGPNTPKGGAGQSVVWVGNGYGWASSDTLGGNNNYTGNNTHIGAEAFSGPTSVSNPCTLGGFIYVSTGGCYTTIPQAIASFSGGNCGTIYLPVGTFTTNITINSSNACSNPSSQMIIQGSGRRSTILKPSSNAAVITLDSTAAAIQSVALRDIGFDNTGTGFSQPAILVQGANINDWHEFRRLRMAGGFKNSINVTGRMVWCVFDQISIENDTDIALNIVEGAAPFNFNKFHAISIIGALGAEGLQLSCTSTCGGQSLLIKNAFDMLDIESGTGIGAVFNNTEGTSVKNAYFETNAGVQVSATGTYARALSITDSYLNTSNNTVLISVTATQVSGEISGNFIANSGAGASTISIAGGSGNGIFVHGNYEPNSGPHTSTADANSNYHVSYYGAYAPQTITTTGSQTPSVTGINNLRYLNATAATITNFTGGDPGQVLTVFNEGTSTVSFTHSNSNGIFMPNGLSATIDNGGSCSFFFEPFNGRWVGYGCVSGSSPVDIRETTAPSSASNHDICYADSTAHGLKCSYNNGTFFNLPLVGTANTWSANQSFNSGTLLPSAAGSTDLGSASLPFGNIWLGTAATNNFKFQPATTAAARTIIVPDFGAVGLGTQNFPYTVVLHTAYTNATTTFSTLGDGTRTVSFPVSANVDYTVTCDIVYQSSATTAGPKIQLTGPASPTAVLLSANGGTNATAFGDAAVTAFSSALTAFGTAGATATNFTLHIAGGISNGSNSGTVALQLAANGAGTLTVAAGSACTIQ